MQFISNSFRLLLLVLLCLSAPAQNMVNPVSQIRWPMATGSVDPTSPTWPCTTTNYGQPYTNTAANTSWVCSSGGWIQITGSSGGGGFTGTGYELNAKNPSNANGVGSNVFTDAAKTILYHSSLNPLKISGSPWNDNISNYYTTTVNNIEPLITQGSQYSITSQRIYTNINGSGSNLGNAPGFTNNVGWTGSAANVVNVNTGIPGINQGFNCSLIHTADGDTTCLYMYPWAYAVNTGASDESWEMFAGNGGEPDKAYQGLVTSGSSTGATTITTNVIWDGNQGPGRYVFNLDETPIVSTYVTGPPTTCSGANGILCTVPIHDAVSSGLVSTGLGTLDSIMDPAPINVAPYYIPQTVNATTVAGALSVGNFVCFIGNHPECTTILSGAPAWSSSTTYITGQSASSGGVNYTSLVNGNVNHTPASSPSQWVAVASPGGGHVQITANLRYGHAAGTQVVQSMTGPMAFDFTANDVQSMYFPNACFAFASTTSVYCVGQRQGLTSGFDFGNVTLASVSTGTMSNTSGVVSMNVQANSAIFGGNVTITIAGASPSQFNGQCASAHFTAPSVLQCNQAASTGMTSTVPGSITLGTNGVGNTAVIVRHMAMTNNVQNAATHAVDGTFILAEHKMSVANGNNIIQLHGLEPAYHTTLLTTNIYNPHTPQNNAGLEVAFVGTGAHGTGADSQFGVAALTASSDAPLTSLAGSGGTALPPNGVQLVSTGSGVWGTGLFMGKAPYPVNTPVINVGCPVSGCNDPAYFYQLWRLFGGSSGGSTATYFPATNTLNIGGVIGMDTLNGNVSNFTGVGVNGHFQLYEPFLGLGLVVRNTGTGLMETMGINGIKHPINGYECYLNGSADTFNGTCDLYLSRDSAGTLSVSTTSIGNDLGTVKAATFIGALTGNSSTATTAAALTTTPTLCSVGNAPTGILPNGNATGCAAIGGGGMVYPAGSGVAVVNGGVSWGTTLTAPSGALVGTTDTQTLTNKTVDTATPTEIGYLSGLSSNIQTQLNARVFIGGGLTSSNISFGAGAGTSPSVSVTGSDVTHQVALTIGSSPSSGDLFTLTFTSSRGHTSYCTMTAFGPAVIAVISADAVHFSANSSTSYTISTSDAFTPVAANTYTWNINCP